MAYKNFALQLFYENACKTEDFCRFQMLAGTVDGLGVQAIDQLGKQVAATTSVVEELRANQVLLQCEIGRLSESLTKRDADSGYLLEQIGLFQEQIRGLQEQIGCLQEQIARLQQQHAAIEQSMSWRLTRPMRTITKHLPHAWRRALRPA
jgi:hypothetical protein